MARRYGVVTASIGNVQTIESVVSQVGKSFVARKDPFAELTAEIERCRRKIWQCVGDDERQQRVSKKAKVSAEKQVEVQTSAHSRTGPVKAQVSPKKENSRANVEFRVNALKVAQLKKELKKRGCDTNGLKKDLRARLLDLMLLEELSERDEPCMVVDKSVPAEVENTEEQEMPKLDPPVDTVMENAIPMTEQEGDLDPSGEKLAEPFQKGATSSLRSGESQSSHSRVVSDVTSAGDQTTGSKAIAAYPQTQRSSAASVSDTSSKGATSELVKGAFKSSNNTQGSAKPIDSSVEPMEVEKQIDTIPEDDTSPPNSDVSGGSKISGARVRELVSKLSNNSQYSSSSSGQSGTSTSALSKSVQAKKEARLARMAEIRGKSQQNLNASTKTLQATKDLGATLPSLATAASSATSGKKNLAAQMREKALRKENLPANQPSSAAIGGTAKQNFPLSQSAGNDTLGRTLKSGLGLASKPLSVQKPKVASPMETYEISDREDSDTDDSDSEAENEKKKKKIPLWAKRENLLPALEHQYNGRIGSRRVDPDDIFHEVQSCDLEAIFGNQKARYHRRTSSGNWQNDEVTVAEKLVYKRTMGFATGTGEI